MATNFKQEGDVLELVAPYTRTSGQGAKVGGLFGVALVDVASGAAANFAVEGVWVLPKTSSQAWTQGQKIYWDDSNKRCDNDGTVGLLIGVASADAGSSDTTGAVRLNGCAPSTLEGPEAAVAALTGTPTGTANGSIVNVAATAASTAGGSTPTAAQVDTGIATAVASIVTGVNEQNKEFLVKINEIIAALQAAGITL
jgi:predicted RecA/RadA family phage recombinase